MRIGRELTEKSAKSLATVNVNPTMDMPEPRRKFRDGHLHVLKACDMK